jgi:hypothetical protein
MTSTVVEISDVGGEVARSARKRFGVVKDLLWVLLIEDRDVDVVLAEIDDAPCRQILYAGEAVGVVDDAVHRADSLNQTRSDGAAGVVLESRPNGNSGHRRCEPHGGC